jgi:hypothetical protein
MRELEYKDCGIQPGRNQVEARSSFLEWQRKQKAQAEETRRLELKSVLDAADRRIEEIKRELRAWGEDV